MASTFPLQPLLRQAAPNLSRRFFTCHQCPNKSPARHVTTSLRGGAFKIVKQSPFLQAFRSQSTISAPAPGKFSLSHVKQRASEAVRDLAESTRKVRRRGAFFPETSSRGVGWWLLGSAASVYGIVVFGALTRLTESGLSITEWRPVTGTLPPLSDASWDIEFMKYRRSPEFQKLNPNMTLSEFKRIFWMEYTHRVWGRVVGLSFLLPTVFFIARRQVSFAHARNLMLINAMIVTQGAVGWWMVKSGLKDDLFALNEHPRVSQYRLATHLGVAFATYTAMLWNGLTIFREDHLLNNNKYKRYPWRPLKLLQRLGSTPLRPFRIAAAFTTGLVAITAISGAFVAGLDAGMIYNEFPYMGKGLTPPKSELFSSFYSRQSGDEKQTDLIWRNMLENPSLAQLDHRILASSTFVAVNALFLYGRLSKTVRHGLTSGGRRMLAGVFGLAWMQVILGLGTLLYMVPVPVAAAHQAGALALLTGFTVLSARTRVPRRAMRVLEERMAKLEKQTADVRNRGVIGKDVWTSVEKARRGAGGPQIVT